MNLRKLIELFRIETDDLVAPFAWQDPELAEYATDAQNEACRRARLLVDSSSADICQYEVLAGDPWITLDPRVIFVRRAKVGQRTSRLTRFSYRDLDPVPGWEAHLAIPHGFITDMETGKLRLYPYYEPDNPLPVPPATATQVDTLSLTVVRLPLTDLTHPDDTVEIHDRYARNLRHWMAYRAYMKRDSEVFNPVKAAEALKLFEAEFGPPSSAVEEEWIERTRDNAEDLDGTF
jgi:hypothetical protein